ncbi:MAG: hypothetical protein H0S79_19150 [Anaerolineaceae bacterium]|nr:hypothetical protein [Anaerolineaceae bacterium]
MKEKKNNKLKKKKSNKIFHAITHPGLTFANFLYFSIFHANKEKIPLPILKYIINYFGGWAGMSIYMPMREYSYGVKKKKLIKTITLITTILILIFLVIYGIWQKSDHFLFGFIQEFLAGLLLSLLAIHFLPEILNPPKNYALTITQSPSLFSQNQDEEKKEILITIKNIGEEVYKKEEIGWELYIPSEALSELDIIENIGSEKDYSGFEGIFLRVSGINSEPLFVDQSLIIARLKINNKVLNGTKSLPFKIYYILRTINGNIPLLEDITLDFVGIGMPIEVYPKWGEITFSDWHNPSQP